MLKVIRKFFAFCGKENRQKFITSIWLSVLQAIFEALKIPAITAMIRALMRGNVETKDILISLGIMLIGILGAGLVKSKATMLQTEGGGCSFTVTAKAEQIPSICTITGLFLFTGLNKISLFFVDNPIAYCFCVVKNWA